MSIKEEISEWRQNYPRRLKIKALLEQEVPQAEIARQVGISRQAVNVHAQAIAAERDAREAERT